MNASGGDDRRPHGLLQSTIGEEDEDSGDDSVE